jgi:hypothetical protein
MITLESLKSYAAGVFSPLSCTLDVSRDANTGRFVLRAESVPFEHFVSATFGEHDLNADMEALVRATRDSLVETLCGGHASPRGARLATEPAPPLEPELATQPDPAPEAETQPDPFPAEASKASKSKASKSKR